MPEKIGKYEVIERIGRGGMGTIFKARDPVLDRLVALKVLSRDVELTADLRARFFREAQACARLSHLNIVTVYDMGEDDARLFIVMELLDGQELRRLIAERTPLALEDKLAIMIQVCDGLHYAHQKGIVHRDIKPGNIMVSPSGQVKILDFGIAHIANTEAGLTRTGLIMGTLRYISPEQVRGQADRLSDVFSVGAVFFEFLSLRPPFLGDDPMQILEQLRTEDPPSLTEIDAAIPPELAAIVKRAMSKNPAERFEDLAQMRGQLEEVQRGLAEELQRVRVQVREHRDQLVALQAALAERIGAETEGEAIPTLDERGRLATAQALESHLAARVDSLRGKIARADRLAPSLECGLEMLAAGAFADAVGALEAVVEDMPEHRRAVDALGQARATVEADRRRQLTAQLVRDAHAALTDGDYAMCLEHLRRAEEVPPPLEARAEIASLRESAQAALAAQEAVRRMRQQAERAREEMLQARRTALAYSATPYAPELWQRAEASATEAQTAFAGEAYAEAQEVFSAAAAAYQRFEAAASEAQARERRAVEQAREQMMQWRERGQAARAAQYAPDAWQAAEAKANEARLAVAGASLARALELSADAASLYRRAEGVADASRQSQRQRVEEDRDRAAQGRQRAMAADASKWASPLWIEANARWTDAETSLAREEHAKATEAFTVALALYGRAEAQAREARLLREESEQARQAMVDCRGRAVAAGASAQPHACWNEAEASAASGESAVTREAYAEATAAFEGAATAYRRAETLAREAARALEAARADAQKARDASAFARRGAAELEAARHASEQWRAAESVEAQGSGALDRQDYAAASALFAEARRRYLAAAQLAGVAEEAESRRSDAMVADAGRFLASGDIEACLRRLGDVLKLRPGHAAAVRLRLEAERRLREVETAAARAETAYIDRRTEGLEQTGQSQGPTLSPAEASEARPSVVASTPVDPTVLARARVDAEPPSGVADAVSVLATAAADSGSEAMRNVPPAESGVTTAASFPRRSHGPIAARKTRQSSGGPRGEGIWRVIAGRRGIVVALGALAAIVPAVIYLASPGPPAPPPLDVIRRQVSEAREDAIRAGAKPLEQFVLAVEKEREALAALGRKDVKTGEERYHEAITGFRFAKTEAESASAAVRAAQGRAAEARKGAELVGAPNRARSLWAEAETAQREAEAAFEQHAFDRAQTLFSAAVGGYKAAEQQGIVLDKQEHAEAERVRAMVAGERKEAERADGRRLASNAFASAQQKENEADAALSHQPASAKAGFEEAVRLYKQAAQQAAAQQVALQRAEAMQAQERVTRARRDAEEAGAGQRATVIVAWAEKKQREASAAFGRAEYVRAERLYSEAQADYETAAQEGKQGHVVPSAQSSSEQAQKRTVIYRDRAVKVEAARLAGDLFSMARAKAGGGDELMKQRSFPLATQYYGEAGDLYLAAARRASEHLEADSARSRMRAEKQRANQKAPEYREALSEEDHGTSAYEQLAYKKAAERFRTAEALYVRAGTKAAAGPPSSTPSSTR